jgi:hypothetical protein
MPMLELLDNTCSFLNDRSSDVTSQFGEDGLVAALFEHIGIVNHWCFEVGAGDGVFLSNTQQWIRQGWHAVLIEANEGKYAELEKLASNNVHTIHEAITPRSLDRILAEVGAPVDMDFGVIDIDRDDFWAWAGMQDYRPRVMLVETATHSRMGVVPSPKDPHGHRQAGTDTIRLLGEAKGYRALARTHCNMLFCREDIRVNA